MWLVFNGTESPVAGRAPLLPLQRPNMAPPPASNMRLIGSRGSSVTSWALGRCIQHLIIKREQFHYLRLVSQIIYFLRVCSIYRFLLNASSQLRLSLSLSAGLFKKKRRWERPRDASEGEARALCSFIWSAGILCCAWKHGSANLQKRRKRGNRCRKAVRGSE